MVDILHDWLDIDFSVAEECLTLAVWTPIRSYTFLFPLHWFPFLCILNHYSYIHIIIALISLVSPQNWLRISQNKYQNVSHISIQARWGGKEAAPGKQSISLFFQLYFPSKSTYVSYKVMYYLFGGGFNSGFSYR